MFPRHTGTGPRAPVTHHLRYSPSRAPASKSATAAETTYTENYDHPYLTMLRALSCPKRRLSPGTRHTCREKPAIFFLYRWYVFRVGNWTFLTNHARVLLCISRDPGARLRDISAGLGITERSAYAIVTDLIEDGYVVKTKDGRRNRYQIRADLPLPEPASRAPTVGEMLNLLAGTRPAQQP
jgi:Winged helix DNA-binding domain